MLQKYHIIQDTLVKFHERGSRRLGVMMFVYSWDVVPADTSSLPQCPSRTVALIQMNSSIIYKGERQPLSVLLWWCGANKYQGSTAIWTLWKSAQHRFTYPAVCGDNVLSGCPTLGLWSRRCPTPECCCAAPSRWSATGVQSACAHKHLEGQTATVSFPLTPPFKRKGQQGALRTCFCVPHSDRRVQRATDHKNSIKLPQEKSKKRHQPSTLEETHLTHSVLFWFIDYIGM